MKKSLKFNELFPALTKKPTSSNLKSEKISEQTWLSKFAMLQVKKDFYVVMRGGAFVAYFDHAEVAFKGEASTNRAGYGASPAAAIWDYIFRIRNKTLMVNDGQVVVKGKSYKKCRMVHVPSKLKPDGWLTIS